MSKPSKNHFKDCPYALSQNYWYFIEINNEANDNPTTGILYSLISIVTQQ